MLKNHILLTWLYGSLKVGQRFNPFMPSEWMKGLFAPAASPPVLDFDTNTTTWMTDFGHAFEQSFAGHCKDGPSSGLPPNALGRAAALQPRPFTPSPRHPSFSAWRGGSGRGVLVSTNDFLVQAASESPVLASQPPS